MSDYWFDNVEREQLCVNPHCNEHGDGSAPCDIPSERPQSLDNASFQNKRVVSSIDAEVYEPTVEVTYSDSE